MKYLEESKVKAVRLSNPPKHNYISYGKKIPTSWKILLNDNIWRRVYVIQYSNAGSAYILIKKEKFFLSFEPSFISKNENC
jgi:hypothetical protein